MLPCVNPFKTLKRNIQLNLSYLKPPNLEQIEKKFNVKKIIEIPTWTVRMIFFNLPFINIQLPQTQIIGGINHPLCR